MNDHRGSVVLSWSGGKDCTMALHALTEAGQGVAGLLTTVTSGVERISMHGVRRSLLDAQAESLGLAVREVRLTSPSSNEQYDAAMADAMRALRDDGIEQVAFGDLFLADVRAYREQRLADTGVTPVFPIWGRDTTALARQLIALGVRAVIVCVDTEQLDPAFAGREFDQALLDDLPDGVDPCGENGEFHTFVYDGPLFSHPIGFTRGDQVTRDGRFRYQDLVELSVVL